MYDLTFGGKVCATYDVTIDAQLAKIYALWIMVRTKVRGFQPGRNRIYTVSQSSTVIKLAQLYCAR